jgi:hypothetical protein
VAATLRAVTASAAGPAAAAGVVSAAVAALTEGVLKTMLLNKLKITVVLLAVLGAVGLGWGSMSYRTLANDQPAVPGRPRQVAQESVKQPNTVQPEQDKARKEDGKKALDEKKQSGQSQAMQVLEMVLQGFQAYQNSKVRVKGKEGERPEKVAPDLYAEAFLKAFQISSEIAKALGTGRTKKGGADQDALDTYGPSILKACERARALKKTLKEGRGSDGKRREKALEALDVFLEAGKELEQAIKQRAKTQAVQQAARAIEDALSRVEKATQDRQTELEALEEIEKAIQRMKTNIREKKDRP